MQERKKLEKTTQRQDRRIQAKTRWHRFEIFGERQNFAPTAYQISRQETEEVHTKMKVKKGQIVNRRHINENGKQRTRTTN